MKLPTRDDRRLTPRRDAEGRAVIWTSSRTQGCIVIDISPKGARLQSGGEAALPLRFDLEFLGTGRRVPAQLVWQRGNVAGVQFEMRPTLLDRLKIKRWFSSSG